MNPAIKTASFFASMLLISLPAAQAFPPQQKQFAKRLRSITVTGECLTRVIPDRGAVTVSSTTVAKKPKEASEKTVAAHEAIKAEIKKIRITG